MIGDVGAYSIYPWTAALEPVQVVSFLPGPYRIEHYRGRVRGVVTSKAPTGPYRGVGRPISTFVMERLMDMAARAKLGIDPQGSAPAQSRRGRGVSLQDRFRHRLGQVRLHRMPRRRLPGDRLRRAARKQEEARAAGRWFGIGIACYAELTGIGSRISVAPGMPINTGTETATIRIDSTGAVTAAFGVASHGQGLETTLAQIVAEHLGARFEDIRIVQGDSAAVAGGTGTYASRSTVLAGGAATLAAQAVREKVFNAASHLLEAAADDLAAERRSVGRRHRSLDHLPRGRTRGLFRDGALAGRGARGARRHQDLRSGVRHHSVGHAHRGGRNRSRDLSRCASNISWWRKTAVG